MIELAEHDPMWKKLAIETIERLWCVFGSMAKDIQHFGSTAIANIKAKPIIDIAIAVDEFEQIKSLIPAMEQEGFIIDYGVRGNEWHGFVVYSDSTRSADAYHIHIIKYNSEKWHGFLHFRDYMNANPCAAQEYEKCKIESMEGLKNEDSRSAYTNSKNAYIVKVLTDSLL